MSKAARPAPRATYTCFGAALFPVQRTFEGTRVADAEPVVVVARAWWEHSISGTATQGASCGGVHHTLPRPAPTLVAGGRKRACGPGRVDPFVLPANQRPQQQDGGKDIVKQLKRGCESRAGRQQHRYCCFPLPPSPNILTM